MAGGVVQSGEDPEHAVAENGDVDIRGSTRLSSGGGEGGRTRIFAISDHL